MAKYIVRGGRVLSGDVRVSGSKNAALPVIFASLTVGGVSKIRGIPDIEDTRVALRLIEEQGARITRLGDVTEIDCSALEYRPPSGTLASRLRASTYLLGACLARFGRVDLPAYGGCNFSARPIDMHVAAAGLFGAREDGCALVAPRLHGATVEFHKKSVGATVNSLIMAASADGVAVIRGAATEPHIGVLIDYLRSAGARISTHGDTLTVVGGSLHGGEVAVPPDSIEAGTYLALGAMTGGEVRVLCDRGGELISFLDAVKTGGLLCDCFDTGMRLHGKMTTKVDIYAAPFPSFPTDLQPIFASLSSVGAGADIYDRVFPSRFGYLSSLAALGVRCDRFDGWARIYPSRIRSGVTACTDLRGGAAAMLLALAADGESVIGEAQILDRGYERLAPKLLGLGADIKYVWE